MNKRVSVKRTIWREHSLEYCHTQTHHTHHTTHTPHTHKHRHTTQDTTHTHSMDTQKLFLSTQSDQRTCCHTRGCKFRQQDREVDVPQTALVCRMYCTRMLSKFGAAGWSSRYSGHEPGSNPCSIMLTSLPSCLMQCSYLSWTAENRWSIGWKMSWKTSSTTIIITITIITIIIIIIKGWVPSSAYSPEY